MTSTRQPAFAALRDSIPIALGYFTVALAFGLYCARAEVPALLAGLISLTNLSSSGQFAGITIIGAQGGYLELALGVGLVNLRYVLMAISLGQRLGPNVGTGKRLVIAAGVTDELYALGMARDRVGFADYAASMVLPIIGWTSGTVVGSVVGEVLPGALASAFGVLLYAMFVAIVVPPASQSRQVLVVVLSAAALGSVLALFEGLDVGWRIIVVTVVVSAAAATWLPVAAPEPGDPPDSSEGAAA